MEISHHQQQKYEMFELQYRRFTCLTGLKVITFWNEGLISDTITLYLWLTSGNQTNLRRAIYIFTRGDSAGSHCCVRGAGNNDLTVTAGAREPLKHTEVVTAPWFSSSLYINKDIYITDWCTKSADRFKTSPNAGNEVSGVAGGTSEIPSDMNIRRIHLISCSTSSDLHLTFVLDWANMTGYTSRALIITHKSFLHFLDLHLSISHTLEGCRSTVEITSNIYYKHI